MDFPSAPESAADAIADFFDRTPSVRHPAVRERAARVRAHLHEYLECGEPTWLGADELTIVRAEREICEVGAVGRATRAADLLGALPAFLAEPWILADALEAKVQSALTEGLAESLARVAPAGAAEELAAIERARRELAQRDTPAAPDSR